MPYLITTKVIEEREPDLLPVVDSVRAVATIDDARESAWSECERLAADAPASQSLLATCEDLPESGGTVGPLPDGTVIEIERVDYQTITDALAGDYMANASLADGQVIDAYNAAQATA